jgi:hypothetical protein
MTAMTCSRVTPAFTVRMTITPVVVADKACAWAADVLVMEVTPIRIELKVSAKTMLRSAFVVLVSAITAGLLGSLQQSWEYGMSRIVGLDVAPDLQFRSTGSGERLLPIVSMGHAAELHSALGGIEAFVCVRSSPTSFAGSRSWLR